MQGSHPCDDAESSIAFCDLMENLMQAALAFSYIEVVVVFGVVHLALTVLQGIFGRSFGSPFFHYLLLVITMLLQILAIVLWFVISEAKGDEECNSSDTDVYNDDLDI
jgi:hypothetical protein